MSPDTVEVELDGTRVRTRPEARAWVEEALEEHGTLYRAAASHRDAFRMQGRGTVYAVPVPPDQIEAALGDSEARWVVRHYRRGGAVASLLGDRYLSRGTPRPFLEMEASDLVRRRGIPTPRVIAAAAYPAGIFYRGDLVTSFIPQALELAQIMFDPRRRGLSGTADRKEALAEAGALIGKMARNGIHHPDLNARNILLQWSGGAPHAHLIDLDRCRVGQGLDPDAGRAMRDRLIRSLRKLAKGASMDLPEGELRVLRESS